jgi:acetyl esterase/lipase
METAQFRNRLLPELKFIADIPTPSYESEAVLAQIRQLPPVPVDPASLAHVSVSDDKLTSFDGTPLAVRIYQPRHQSSDRLIVWCHGGGFFAGGVETEQRTCVNLAALTGAVVVAPAYRLAPEHRFPTGLEDCYAALVWSYTHAAALRTTPHKLLVGGTSSGACLAAGVALLARDRQGPALALQVLLVPPLAPGASTASIREFAQAPGGWDARTTTQMWRYYLPTEGSEVSAYAAPLLVASCAQLPPAYVVTVELDPLRDEGQAYAQRLQAAGVAVEHRYYPGVPHFFLLGAATDFFHAFTKELARVVRAV